MRRSWALLGACGAACLLTLAACAGAGQPTATVPAATAEPPTGYPVQSPTPAQPPTAYAAQSSAPAAPPTGYPPTGYPATVPAGGAVDAVSRQAVAMLAAKLAVDASQIQVTLAASIDWPDSSLGCPQPGMAYSQVVTPGYRIVLTYKQTEYEYHADRRGRLVTCQPK